MSEVYYCQGKPHYGQKPEDIPQVPVGDWCSPECQDSIYPPAKKKVFVWPSKKKQARLPYNPELGDVMDHYAKKSNYVSKPIREEVTEMPTKTNEKAEEIREPVEEQITEDKELLFKSKSEITGLDDSYFKENANVGLEDMDSNDMPVPTLTLIQSNSKVRGADNRPYTPGMYFYRATRLTYDEIVVSMLVITKSMMPLYTDKNQTERVYVLMGAINSPDGFLPFKMFCRGWGAAAVRQLVGDIKALKKPMYSLQVKIGSKEKTNEKGTFFIPEFEILGVQKNPEDIIILEDLAKTYSANRQAIGAQEEEVAVDTANMVADDIQF